MWNKKIFEEKVLKSVFVEVGLRILALNVPKSKTLNAIISELLFCDLSTFRTGLFNYKPNFAALTWSKKTVSDIYLFLLIQTQQKLACKALLSFTSKFELRSSQLQQR